MTQSTYHHSRGGSTEVPLTSAVELESSASSSHVYHRKSASMDTIHSNIPLDSIPLSTRDHPDSSSTFQPIPLSHSDSVYETSGPNTTSEERHLTLLPSVALVTGMMIGSGIFSSPGLIVALTGSVGASLLVWLVGGLLAWTGASSYAELGAAIPLDGGTQVYLSYAVRKKFMFTNIFRRCYYQFLFTSKLKVHLCASFTVWTISILSVRLDGGIGFEAWFCSYNSTGVRVSTRYRNMALTYLRLIGFSISSGNTSTD
jgi:amino acid permease